MSDTPARCHLGDAVAALYKVRAILESLHSEGRLHAPDVLVDVARVLGRVRYAYEAACDADGMPVRVGRRRPKEEA